MVLKFADIPEEVLEETNCDLHLPAAWCINAKNSLSSVHGFSQHQLAIGTNPKMTSKTLVSANTHCKTLKLVSDRTHCKTLKQAKSYPGIIFHKEWSSGLKLHSELEGSQFKPHYMLGWSLGPNLITRLLVTFRLK